MADEPHLVPRERTRVETRASNSRFITTISRASSVEEARCFIQLIRDEMPDATHHVFAFRIGHGASVTEGMSDDGEPSGTSGPPALAVLRGSGLGDAVLVITRYFGGTKLGTGGLVAAYGDAAKAVIEAVPTEEKIDRVEITVTMPYEMFDGVKRLIEGAGGLIEDEEFQESVTLHAHIPVSNLKNVRQELTARSGGKLILKMTGPTDN